MLENQTPMLIIQKYNGFRQGIRDGNLCRITEEKNSDDKAEVKAMSSMYSQHSLESTTDYASDEEDEEDEEDETVPSDPQTGKNKLNTYHWSRRSHNRNCRHWSASRASWQRKVDHEKTKKDTLPSTVIVGDVSEESGINLESDEGRRITTETSLASSHHSDDYNSTLEKTKSEELSTEQCKVDNNSNSKLLIISPPSRSEADNVSTPPVEAVWTSVEDFTRTITNTSGKDTEINKQKLMYSIMNQLQQRTAEAGSVRRTERHLADDNFYLTVLPSELGDDQTITKFNPLASFDDSSKEDEDEDKYENEEGGGLEDVTLICGVSSRAVAAPKLKQHDDNRKQYKNEDEIFQYSIEEFPHPPDHFLVFDSLSLSSGSITMSPTVDDDEDDYSDIGTLGGGDATTTVATASFFLSSRHLTLQINDENMVSRRWRSISSSSSDDSSSGFVRQCRRSDSNFIDSSVSTYFAFDASRFSENQYPPATPRDDAVSEAVFSETTVFRDLRSSTTPPSYDATSEQQWATREPTESDAAAASNGVSSKIQRLQQVLINKVLPVHTLTVTAATVTASTVTAATVTAATVTTATATSPGSLSSVITDKRQPTNQRLSSQSETEATAQSVCHQQTSMPGSNSPKIKNLKTPAKHKCNKTEKKLSRLRGDFRSRHPPIELDQELNGNDKDLSNTRNIESQNTNADISHVVPNFTQSRGKDYVSETRIAAIKSMLQRADDMGKGVYHKTHRGLEDTLGCREPPQVTNNCAHTEI